MRTKESYSEAGKLGYLASAKKIKQQHLGRIEKYNENPKMCRFCHKILNYKNRKLIFCNHSCSAKFNNTLKGKIILKNCLNCHEEFNPHRGSKGKFCSCICRSKYKKLQIIESIKCGNYNPKSHNMTLLRNFLIETRGHRCETCKLSEWLAQKIVLTIDHKDGNASNNKLDNVQLLCWNCHSLTPTFGSKNKGSARQWRKNRYLPASSNRKIHSS